MSTKPITEQPWQSDAPDTTPFGQWGDHCAYCGHDWKQPHDPECQNFTQCEFPPGCDKDCAPARRLCREHYKMISELFAPVGA